MNRYKIRENVFILVFERIFIQDDITEIIQEAYECDEIEINDEVISMFKGVEQHKEEIDKIISEHLNKWSISRISKIALAILRVAVYEMIYIEKIAAAIAINEAVELAKEYSTQEDAAFINGVLGSFARISEEPQ